MTALMHIVHGDAEQAEIQRMYCNGNLRDAARYLHRERGFDRDHTLVVLEVLWQGLSPLQAAYVDQVLTGRIGAAS